MAMFTPPHCTLSFCIPTYNRSVEVGALVRRVLQCPAADIEVLVLDNGSTDDTLKRLAQIDDPRLSIYSNGHNRGVLFNVVNVLLRGRGQYSVLLLDKDSVDPTLIESFRDFLLREAPACGYSEYGGDDAMTPAVFAPGMPALMAVAYICHHPTGYFYRSDLLRQLDVVNRFVDYDYVGHFPFDFIMTESSLRGPAAVVHAPLFAQEPLSSAAATKSFGTNAAKEDAFFSPQGRLKMTVNFTCHISGLPVPASVKRRLILDRITEGLFAATVGYRCLLRNEAICTHYHIGTRRVGVMEMMRTGRTFLRSFFEAYPRGAVAQDVQVSRANVIAEVAARLLRALKRRLQRQAA